MSRQIILDTETTGLEVDLGHRIIEVGCIELRNPRPTQNNFHRYINPEREIHATPVNVQGITNEPAAPQPNLTPPAHQTPKAPDGPVPILPHASLHLGSLTPPSPPP